MSRKGSLNREAVVRAAADLVNAEGAGAFSLARLAKELGIRTPSLYNHVDGLAGLERELALMNARAMQERLSRAAIGKSGAVAVRAISRAYRDHIKAAPGVYLLTLRAAHSPSGTEEVPTVDAELEDLEERIVAVVLAVLASFGLQGEDAVHAARAWRSVVHGFASLEVAGGFGLPLDLDESFHRLVEGYIRGLPAQAGASSER